MSLLYIDICVSSEKPQIVSLWWKKRKKKQSLNQLFSHLFGNDVFYFSFKSYNSFLFCLVVLLKILRFLFIHLFSSKTLFYIFCFFLRHGKLCNKFSCAPERKGHKIWPHLWYQKFESISFRFEAISFRSYSCLKSSNFSLAR